MLGGNQDTPSFTRAKRSWYCAGSFGTITFAVIVFATVGATSPPSGVRTPSHETTTLPVASYQWYVRLTGVEPPAFHVWLPVFVSVTGIWSAAPAGAACGAAPAATTYVATRFTGWTVMRIGALAGNQVTPSFTSANRRRYWPGVVGASTFAVTARRPCVGTSGGASGVRTPSQTTV